MLLTTPFEQHTHNKLMAAQQQQAAPNNNHHHAPPAAAAVSFADQASLPRLIYSTRDSQHPLSRGSHWQCLQCWLFQFNVDSTIWQDVGLDAQDSDLAAAAAQQGGAAGGGAAAAAYGGALRFMRSGLLNMYFEGLGGRDVYPLDELRQGGAPVAGNAAVAPDASLLAAGYDPLHPPEGMWQEQRFGKCALSCTLGVLACLYHRVLNGALFPHQSVPGWQRDHEWAECLSYFRSKLPPGSAFPDVELRHACMLLYPLCRRVLPRSSGPRLRVGTFDCRWYESPCMVHALNRNSKRAARKGTAPFFSPRSPAAGSPLRGGAVAPMDPSLGREVGYYAEECGYVKISLRRGLKEWEYAHRFLCWAVHGPPPLCEQGGRRMEVIHLCDNKFCLNPLHLVWGTHKQNSNPHLYMDAWRRLFCDEQGVLVKSFGLPAVPVPAAAGGANYNNNNNRPPWADYQL